MQNYKKICDLLSNEACKAYVKKLLHLSPAQVALQYRDKIPCDATTLALIIQLYQKAQNKLPLWVQNFCAITPKSFEQSSSQITAYYKSTFIRGQKLLVLGGGLGVDEWAFSNTFQAVLSIDLDEDLNEIVAFNLPLLAINNVKRHAASAESYLENCTEKFDCIYTDPDRRDDKGLRIKTLQQSTPDIIALLPKIWQLTNTLVIKASPLIDSKGTIAELGNVCEVRVIAIENEVKEVLFTAKKDFASTPAYIAANYVPSKGWQEFTAQPLATPVIGNVAPAKYFYEPNVAIIKAGLHHAYAHQCGLQAIDAKTAYYTADDFIHDFMGRVFSIINVVPFSKSGVKQYLSQQKITKANIARRNYRMTTEELKKLFKITDGGHEYLFFTQQNGKGYMYHCRKPNLAPTG